MDRILYVIFDSGCFVFSFAVCNVVHLRYNPLCMVPIRSDVDIGTLLLLLILKVNGVCMAAIIVIMINELAFSLLLFSSKLQILSVVDGAVVPYGYKYLFWFR